MAPRLLLRRREASVLKGKREGCWILGQIIVPNTSTKSWEGGGPGDVSPRMSKREGTPEEGEGKQERTGVFSVGAQGRGQRTPRARACWRLPVGQGGNRGQGDGRETGALGLHLPAP